MHCTARNFMSAISWFRTFSTLLLFAAVIGSTPSATAGGVIMFVADTRFDFDNNLSEIHLMQTNGNKHRRILPKYTPLDASMNSKGSSIAYARNGANELRMIDTNGRNDRLLTKVSGPVSKIQWSPNGRYIAIGHTTRLSLSFTDLEVVSIYDVKRKKIVTTYKIFENILPATMVSLISKIDWSPNSKRLAVSLHTDFIFFANDPFASPVITTYVVDTKTAKIEEQGKYPNFGFWTNNAYMVVTTTGHLGVVNIKTKKVSTLLDLGPTGNIQTVTRVPGGKSLIVQISKIQESIDANDANLAELRGKSRQADLGYDFVRIDVASRKATIVTPSQSSFLAAKATRPTLEYRQRTSRQTFRTDVCWGWVVTIKGTSRNDRIIGTPYNDVIHGLAGNDKISGGGGNDVLCGGTGHDQLAGQNGNDVMIGDTEINHVNSVGDGYRGRDRLSGGDGVDTLYGDWGNDVLRGGNDSDWLHGGSGDDKLDGQGGEQNILHGGDGRDRCVNFTSSELCE